MKIHHLNCATFCPPLFAKRVNELGKLVCHCLLIETNDGLALVDTGLGTAVIAEPKRRTPPGSAVMLGARLDRAETALLQVEALGFSQKDVRHILLTHLDFDHAGGIADFPDATVHIFEDEYQAAHKRGNFYDKMRYCPAQWEHGPRWQRYSLPSKAESWFGFESVRAMPGSTDEILIVPVVGHSRGHAAIAVRTASGWLLHCGDAYFYEGEMDPSGRRCTGFLDGFQRFAQSDGAARVRNQERLRQLANAHRGEVSVFCAHDPSEFAKYSRQSPR
jgi:glyoxylase-like metal-dependent hydrolase (beta-lactamase superfamily II)